MGVLHVLRANSRSYAHAHAGSDIGTHRSAQHSTDNCALQCPDGDAHARALSRTHGGADSNADAGADGDADHDAQPRPDAQSNERADNVDANARSQLAANDFGTEWISNALSKHGAKRCTDERGGNCPRETGACDGGRHV